MITAFKFVMVGFYWDNQQPAADWFTRPSITICAFDLEPLLARPSPYLILCPDMLHDDTALNTVVVRI